MEIQFLFKKMFLWLISCLPLLLLGQSAFPTYPNTGDEAADKAEYAKAKAVWIQENPEAYKAMGGDQAAVSSSQGEKEQHLIPTERVNNITKAKISRKELATIPAEKAAYIQSHLDIYEITD